MGKLILVRHGESTGNRERIYATRPHELALTELGEQQAREAGARIARLFAPELVVASTYVRARETARLIAEVLSLPLRIEEDLHERDLGQFRGQPYNAMSTAPDFDARRPWQWRPPQGESLEDVQARVVPVIERLAQSHRERDVVVVSHGGVMAGLWARFSRSWEQVHIPANCGMVVVEHDASGYRPPVVIGDDKSEKDTGG